MPGMSDQASPVVVSALSYYDRSNEPWLPVTRLLSLGAIVESGAFLLSFLSRWSLTLWQMLVPGPNRAGVGSTWQFAIELPAGIREGAVRESLN